MSGLRAYNQWGDVITKYKGWVIGPIKKKEKMMLFVPVGNSLKRFISEPSNPVQFILK